MPDSLPILYVKTGCPWCAEVIDYLKTHAVEHVEKNVTDDRHAFEEMRQKSHQTKAPVLDWHGQILADFGVVELRPFLRKQAGNTAI
jgi:glutaredoxin